MRTTVTPRSQNELMAGVLLAVAVALLVGWLAVSAASATRTIPWWQPTAAESIQGAAP